MTTEEEAQVRELLAAYNNGKKMSELPPLESGADPTKMTAEVLYNGASRKAPLSVLAPYESAAKTAAANANAAAQNANNKVSQLSGFSIDCATDNVFIMTHRCKTYNDNFPLAIKPQYWVDGYQSKGEVADGVLVIEGGHHLVVAPTEAESGLLWSSANINGNTVYGYYNDRVKAFSDFNGQQNTANIIKASSDAAVTNTESYAAGFCNLYSRANANGKGLTAGRWWLPSIGELLMIYANMAKINYCLSLISGATPLQRTWYWSSSEFSAAIAWYLFLYDGALNTWLDKSQYKGHVRAVSAFLN